MPTLNMYVFVKDVAVVWKDFGSDAVLSFSWDASLLKCQLFGKALYCLHATVLTTVADCVLIGRIKFPNIWKINGFFKK